MAIQVEEKFESPEGWSNSPGKAGGTKVYVIYDDHDEEITHDDALAELLDKTDDYIDTGEYRVYRMSRIVDPVNLSTWIGRVAYSPDPVADNKNDYQFDTTGGTQHITHDLNTIASYGSSPPNVQGAINTNANGIDGVDITVPIFAFSETLYKTTLEVSENYKKDLMGLTGCVNNDSFRGHSAGEVLFLGARGGRRSGEDWEITYLFAVSPNKTGLTVGGISGIAKKGWEYIDVLSKPTVSGDVTLQTTVAVYVHQVYPYAAFSGIGI